VLPGLQTQHSKLSLCHNIAFSMGLSQGLFSEGPHLNLMNKVTPFLIHRDQGLGCSDLFWGDTIPPQPK
jgi:hypothetical protein